jgi:hypothetical protein
MTVSANKPVYRMRLQSDSDSHHDDVRHLRQLLKVLLRRFHLRCIELEQEQTPRA